MCDKHCASSAEKGACLILSPMLLCANNNKSKLAKIKTETKQKQYKNNIGKRKHKQMLKQKHMYVWMYLSDQLHKCTHTYMRICMSIRIQLSMYEWYKRNKVQIRNIVADERFSVATVACYRSHRQLNLHFGFGFCFVLRPTTTTASTPSQNRQIKRVPTESEKRNNNDPPDRPFNQ